jgi:signal transduction histidine kinase
MKTPLATMRTICDVCLRRSRTLDEYREALTDLRDESIKLGKMTERLLAMAKVSRAELRTRFTPVDVGALCHNTRNRLLEVYSLTDKDLLEDYEERSFVSGDAVLLQQAVWNIVENAIQHTGSESPVSVKVYRDAADIKIEITDKGPGFPEHILQGIDKPEQNTGDSCRGLGLIIVSDIMRLHSGHVDIHPGSPNGSVITLTIPSE